MKTASIMNIFFIFIVLCLISKEGSAQDWSRTGRTEVTGLLQYMDGDTTHDDYLDQKVNVDDTTVFGVGVGHNFNDHLNLNGDLWFGNTDIESGVFTGDTDLVGLDLNVDYNILEGRFTPLITGGIGFIRFDGELSLLGLDYSETNFSYNVGTGFRWDIQDHFLVKVLYKITWTKLEDTDDALSLNGISLRVGYIF